STPADGAVDVARSAWLRLELAAAPDAAALARLVLRCAGADDIAVRATPSGDTTVLLDPVGTALLPPASTCTLVAGDTSLLAFTTAPAASAGAPPTVLHDRADTRRLAPFPDDFFTVDDGATPTGRRVAVPLPEGPADLQQIFGGLLPETNRLDGFSP